MRCPYVRHGGPGPIRVHIDSHRQLIGPSTPAGMKEWLWKPSLLNFWCIARFSSGVIFIICSHHAAALPGTNSW